PPVLHKNFPASSRDRPPFRGGGSPPPDGPAVTIMPNGFASLLPHSGNRSCIAPACRSWTAARYRRGIDHLPATAPRTAPGKPVTTPGIPPRRNQDAAP